LKGYGGDEEEDELRNAKGILWGEGIKKTIGKEGMEEKESRMQIQGE